MKDGGAKARTERRGEAGRVSSDAARVARTKVQDLAKRLGNEEITKRIEAGNATRDELLALVLQQLETVRGLQVQELGLSHRNASYDWWRLAGNGIQQPDPTRWKDPARAWEQAVDAICRGDLKKGHELVEDALTRQQETIDGMTTLVDRSEMDARPDTGDLARIVAMAPTSGSCAEPLPIRDLLGAITRVGIDPPQAPNDRDSEPRWWAEEEEEDEEEDDEEDPDGLGGGGAP